MLLVLGTAAMALAVVSFTIVLLGSRNPREPSWARDMLVGSIYLPVIIGITVLGIGCFAKFLIAIGSRPPDLQELALTIAIAAASLILLKVMRIKKRLAEFAAMKTSVGIIKPAAFFKQKAAAEGPEKPVRPRSGKKKAA
jgi:uncharacterized BrkB/YihY/UPF0761 family membrane protein